MKIKYLIIIALSLGSGCEKSEHSYAELIKNPKLMKEELDHCHANPNLAYCKTVFAKDSALMKAIAEQQNNPEDFGQKIMDVERACVRAKQAKEKARQTLATLQATKTSDTAIKAAKQALEKATVEFNMINEQLNMLLAVAGLNSP